MSFQQVNAMNGQPTPQSSPQPEKEQPNASSADHVALKIARDDIAVELLTNRVLTQARAVVFAEQRGLAVAAAAILAAFGITSWLSIDDKVNVHVDKRIDATVAEKVATVQQKTTRLEQLSAGTEESLQLLDGKLKGLNKAADEARKSIAREVASIQKLREALESQASSVQRRPEATDAQITAAFGPLPPNTSVVTGSGVKSFGTGSDLATGGAFTTAFLKASRSNSADLDGDQVISLEEVTKETRKSLVLFSKQEPIFAGDDVGLFRLSAATSPAPEGGVLAIIVGVGRISPNMGLGTYELPGPKHDIVNVRTRLEEQGTINRQSSTLVTLADDKATWREVEAEIAKLAPTTNDIVLFYFSGRGKPPAALATSPDGDTAQLSVYFYDQVVSIAEIVKRLELLNAQHRVLIIDA